MIRTLLAAALLVVATGCSIPVETASAPARSDQSGKPRLPEAPPPPTLADDPMMCTADAKACPDGSFVSRDPARGCAFAACPGATPP